MLGKAIIMKLKLDDKGSAVLQDGKPVYVLDDGREVPHDAAGTVATISRLNGEAKSHREAKEAAELALKLAQRTTELNTHIIGGSFASSKFIAEKLAIPADMAQKFFGDRFKVEAGKLVPLGADGNPIFSSTNHGNHADFEEAIQVMVGQYSHKDSILKGTGASGGGAGGSKGGSGGAKEIPRSQFFAMSPQAQGAAIQGGAVVID